MSDMGQPRKLRFQFTLRTVMFGVALLVVSILVGREIYFRATSFPLDEAIAAFNKSDLADSDEIPVTEDEIIASIGNQLSTLDEPVRSMFVRIAQRRRLPKGAHFDAVRVYVPAAQETYLRKETDVNLNVMTGENTGYRLRIRGRSFRYRGRPYLEMPPTLAVQTLSLRNQDITGEELPKLLEGQAEIRKLDLSHNLLDEKALDYLHPLGKLEVINLEHTNVTDEGLLSLTQLPNLKEVHLYRGPGHRTTAAGRRKLREAFPELKMPFITH